MKNEWKIRPPTPFWYGPYSILRWLLLISQMAHSSFWVLPYLYFGAAFTLFWGSPHCIWGCPLLNYLLQIPFKIVRFRGASFSSYFFSFLLILSSVRGERCTTIILTNIIGYFRQDRPAELVTFQFKSEFVQGIMAVSCKHTWEANKWFLIPLISSWQLGMIAGVCYVLIKIRPKTIHSL